jgi:hypothetical protein
MVEQTAPQQKPQIPHEPTPRDDAKKVVSEILKRVDQLIRKGDLDHAQLEIRKAKEVDSRNVYVFALEERISILKTDQYLHLEETLNNIESTPSSVIGNISKTEIEIPQMPTSPKPKPTMEVSLPAPAETDPHSIPSPLSTIAATKPQEKRSDRILDRAPDLDSFRQALTHAWCDGSLTEDEERQ